MWGGIVVEYQSLLTEAQFGTDGRLVLAHHDDRYKTTQCALTIGGYSDMTSHVGNQCINQSINPPIKALSCRFNGWYDRTYNGVGSCAPILSGTSI